jgi:hypothetical protein
MKISSKIVAMLSTSALAAAMLVGTGVPAQAHGGGLDWQGGHNCRVGSCAGTYHCHQPRGGICAKAKGKGRTSSEFTTKTPHGTSAGATNH